MENVRIQDDLYTHVNGAKLEELVIPDDKPTAGGFAELADQVEVMYAGEIIESAPTVEVINSPQHPYTRALLKAVPRFDAENKKLDTIPGQVPLPGEFPSGCRFAERCIWATDECKNKIPMQQKENHFWRCIKSCPDK